MPDYQDKTLPALGRLSTGLILVGVCLTLIGFFSPWIPHATAGLALTGFEIGEWIKFTPEMRSESPPLRRANFYWPPVVAAAGLAALVAASHHRRPVSWLLVLLAALLSLVPFPLLEELRGPGGIAATAGRLGLVGLGFAVAALAAWRRKVAPRLRGAVLVTLAIVGLWLVSAAFSAAEPIVERLYAHLIDPGLGYHLTRFGMLLVLAAGGLQLLPPPGSRDPAG